MLKDAQPAWMVDDHGKVLPRKWFRWFGMTPGKAYTPIKRQGRWWTLGVGTHLTDSEHVNWETAPRPDVHAWMQENVGNIGDNCWDFRSKLWYDRDEGEVLEMRLYFPDRGSLTQFLLAFADG